MDQDSHQSDPIKRAFDFLFELTSNASIYDYTAKSLAAMQDEHDNYALEFVKKIYDLCSKSYVSSGQSQLYSPNNNLNSIVLFASRIINSDRAILEFEKVDKDRHQIAYSLSKGKATILTAYIKSVRLSKSKHPIILHPAHHKSEFKKQTEVIFANYREFRSTDEFVEMVHDFINDSSHITKILCEEITIDLDFVGGVMWHLRSGFGEEHVASLMKRIMKELPSMNYLDFVDLCEVWDKNRKIPLTWSLELVRAKNMKGSL